MLGDGKCDEVCNTEKCSFDAGDCPNGSDEETAPGCKLSMIGDGKCD